MQIHGGQENFLLEFRELAANLVSLKRRTIKIRAAPSVAMGVARMKKDFCSIACFLLAALVCSAHAGGQVGPFQPQQRQVRGPRAQPFVSVVDFGAIGQDDRWDSDAIQRAIDSLPKPTLPGSKEPAGGIVVLPVGRYTLDKPLRIHNGITLRGEGPGTVLYAPADQPAVLLFCPWDHGYVSSTAIEDLSIYTDKSPGILADKSVGNIVQSRFENLLISAGGCAIDLNPGLAQKTYTQNTIFRNIHCYTFGGPALQLWGNANHIDQINTEGGTRKDFKAERAIVTVSGGLNDIRACIIEANKPSPAVAFHVSGSFTWSHNWAELDPTRDGVAYVFENVETGIIDTLYQILPTHKAKFINCTSIQIRSLNIDGEFTALPANIELDDKSSIRIDEVVSRMDCGMFDDPRIWIGSNYTKKGGTRLDLPSRTDGPNMLANSSLQDAAAWTPQWDTGAGVVRGEASVERNIGRAGNRLKIQLKDNPRKRPLWVNAPLRVPPELEGTRAVARFRIDGPGQVVVYQSGKEIPTRAMNTLTACVLPEPVKDGQVLQFVLPSETGTYYISDASVTPK
jgi:hypothetical protein